MKILLTIICLLILVSCSEEVNNKPLIEDSIKQKTTLEGPVKTYFENGQLKFLFTYKDGIENGVFESYYENGNPFGQGTYEDGRRSGQWRGY